MRTYGGPPPKPRRVPDRFKSPTEWRSFRFHSMTAGRLDDKCPECGHYDLSITRLRDDNDSIHRIEHCMRCGYGKGLAA